MRPLRPPTHRGLSFEKLAKLASEVEGVAADGRVEIDALLDLAAELGVGCENLLAALVTTDIALTTTLPVCFEVCVGGCQEWGALALTEHLLDIRDAQNPPSFDILPRPCLDKCQSAAAVILATPDGRALIPAATPADLDEALASLE